jgi:hypothetical protein
VREDEAGIFDIKFTALSHNSKSISHPFRVSLYADCHSCYWCCWFIDIERRGCYPQGLHLDCKCGMRIVIKVGYGKQYKQRYVEFNFGPET